MNRPSRSATHCRFRTATQVACLVAGGCTNSPAPSGEAGTTPAPQIASELPIGTIAGHNLGDRVMVTASVASVITARSFVIGDADLLDRGLLVFGGPGSGVRRTALVTV